MGGQAQQNHEAGEAGGTAKEASVIGVKYAGDRGGDIPQKGFRARSH